MSTVRGRALKKVTVSHTIFLTSSHRRGLWSQVSFLLNGSPASLALPSIHFINLAASPAVSFFNSPTRTRMGRLRHAHTQNQAGIARGKTLPNNTVAKVSVMTWGSCNNAKALILIVRKRKHEQSSALTCMVIMLVAWGQISEHASTGSAYHTSVWIPKPDKAVNVTTIFSPRLPPRWHIFLTLNKRNLHGHTSRQGIRF